MSDNCVRVANALGGLAADIKSSNSADPKLSDAIGWQAPPLKKTDIVDVVQILADRIRSIDDSRIDPTWDPADDIEKIEFVRLNAVPQLWNGNGFAAYGAIDNLLSYLKNSFGEILLPRVDWEKLEDEELIPKKLAGRVRSLKTRIDALYAGSERLEEKVREIEAARQAALRFPEHLQSLDEARARVADAEKAVTNAAALALAAVEDAQKSAKLSADSAAEAEGLVENTADAYRAATTKGLSESFQARAQSSADSMWVWVAMLIVALGLGGYFGGRRLEIIERLLEKNSASGLLTVNLVLAALSIAAPVWFAWIATKQIGHRFRLAEDYAFKAAVARAYEGYRREAAKIDEGFSARLFASALDRLEEAPLRFVEHETYGSPWHEVLFRRTKTKAGPEMQADTPKRKAFERPSSLEVEEGETPVT